MRKGKSMAVSRKKTDGETTNDVAVVTPEISSPDLLSIGSFEDALNLMKEVYGTDNVVTADSLIGDGFRLLKNKDLVCETALAIVKWDFKMGKFSDNFVIMWVVTRDNAKYIVTDGGVGVCQQLWDITRNTGRKGGLVCANGFVRSDYPYTDEVTGELKEASTYYINTTAL